MKILVIKQDKKRMSQLGALATQVQELCIHLKGGRSFHFDSRPWFVVLGAEGADQTWLQSLELKTSWQSKRKLKKDAGEGADLLVTPDAVFINPDFEFWSAKAKYDASKWQTFCKLINKKRSVKAPYGIVICVPFTLMQDAEKLSAFQIQMQQALREASEAYFGKIPVYLVVTGLESISGFQAYMDKIRLEQKEQVFGLSQAFGKTNSHNEEAELKALHQQLSQKVLAQLQWESKATENSDALFFPEELASFYPKLIGLSHHITHATPNVHRMLLRGLCFTGAADKQTYFSKALVQDVLLKEIKAFSTWHQIDEWLNCHRKRVLGGISAGMIVLLSIWWLGVLHDQSYLNQMSEGLVGVNAAQNDPMSTLVGLQQLYDMGEHEDRFMMRFLGIFFPNKVADAVSQKYASALQNVFEPMMASDLNQGLAASLKNAKTSGLSDMALLNQDAAIYNWLSSYLMLNELNHFDPNVVRNMLKQAWQGDSLLQTKVGLYDDLVRFGLVQENIDPNLVAQARSILGNQPIEIRAFFALKANSSEPPVMLGGGDTSVDGFYTQAAAKEYLGSNESSSIKQTLEQSWVLGNDATVTIDKSTIQSLTISVNQFYWSQYFSTWQSALNSLNIKHFASMTDAANYLSNAGKAGSPFTTLWQQMATNLTGIDTKNYPSDSGLNSFASSMNAYLSNQQNFNAIVSVLNQLGSTINSNNSTDGSLSLSASILNQQIAALTELQQLAAQAPQPIQNILNSLLTQTIQSVFGTGQSALQKRWQTDVTGNCRKVVGDSSFFVGASNNNLSLNAFAHFFNASGVGGQYINSRVTNLVSIQNGQVQSRSAYGVAFRMPGNLTNNIVRLLLIRSAFFGSGSNPNFTVNFTPMYLSKNLADFTLTDGGQSLFYQNGPRISQNFTWPNNSGDVVVKFTGLNGQVLTERYPGQWGLVKFLNSATVSVIDPTHYQLTFSLNSYTATYEGSLTSGIFAGILALQNFQCN